MYGEIQRGILPCMVEIHLREYENVTLLQQPIVVRDHLHHFSSCRGDERWRLVEKHLEELLPVIPDDWDLVMSIGKKLSWALVDMSFVESLGLAKASGIFKPYSQLQVFFLSFPDNFVRDNSMRRDR
jgi:hypothetical protein